MTKQYILSDCQTFFKSPVLEGPYEIIKSRCPASESPNLTLKYRCSLLIALTRYPRDKLKNADGNDAMGFWNSLAFTLSIQAIEDKFHFDLLPNIGLKQVIPPSRDNIFILVLKFLVGEANLMVSMPIIFVKQCKTPVITNSFSSISNLNKLPNSFKDPLSGHKVNQVLKSLYISLRLFLCFLHGD